ncbi:MAG TPA: dipeptidase [Thermomonas sp.]|uniref:dipeptidase n=1 Tax=Thermomonas sp. TaxID=1971895 RepID=UPI002B9F6F17|nr:dipeptidase [Thermomonas sp.]
MRHAALAASILVSLALAAPIAQAQDAATRLAQDAIIVDTHIDAPGILMDKWADLGVEAKDREFDHPKSRAGGLDVAFMSIYTSPKQDADGSAWQVANQMIDGVEALVQRHPGKFAILASPKDAARLIEGGRVLLPMGMENGAPLGDQLANVQFFFDRGVRYITLAHSANNRLADSSYALEKKWNGLSPFGREVVREMNRVGMIVDVSHLGDASAMEAIQLSRVPVIASHSALRHFTPDFERNISDDIAKAVAARGGVIQIPFGTAFIDPASAADTQAHFRAINDFDRNNAALKAQGQPPKDRAAFDTAWDAAHPPRASTLVQVLDQIDYGVKLLGIDHVGIGSDFDGVDGELPAELKTVADFPHLVAGLQARGYKDADIRKLLGGNLLRAWGAIEDGAGK